MIVGVPTETKQGERRVALTPLGVTDLVGNGHRVIVQRGAGVASSIPDRDYDDAGAVVLDRAEDVFGEARLIVKVKEPSGAETALLTKDHILFTYLHLAPHPDVAARLAESGATCVAYETVQLTDGSLPLLAPMSEIAGRMSVQVGSRWLEGGDGGKGKLLGGATGVPPARVTVLGAGVAGKHAARIASGMGAAVTVMDIDTTKLRRLADERLPGVATCCSSLRTVEEFALASDLIIGAVLVAGGTAPRIVSEELVRALENGTVIVDISIDQGGCIDTSHETTHAEPVYTLHGVIHYAVANIPGVVPHTSTYALTGTTLPYVLALSEGFERAFSRYPELERGINVAAGEYTHPTVARALGETTRSPRLALGLAG
ncbi:MAG: alanine dehydrogenase [Acidimicrobiales bacterium]